MHLRNQGVDSYYPMVQIEKLQRGHRVARMEPMFPSYLFVQVDLDTFPPIASTPPGVCVIWCALVANGPRSPRSWSTR